MHKHLQRLACLGAEGGGTTLLVLLSNSLFLQELRIDPLWTLSIAVLVGSISAGLFLISAPSGWVSCNPALTVLFALLRLLRWSDALLALSSQAFGVLVGVFLFQWFLRAQSLSISASLIPSPFWLALILETAMTLVFLLLLLLLIISSVQMPNERLGARDTPGWLASLCVGSSVTLVTFAGARLQIMWPNLACALGLTLVSTDWQQAAITLLGLVLATLSVGVIIILLRRPAQQVRTASDLLEDIVFEGEERWGVSSDLLSTRLLAHLLRRDEKHIR